MPPLTAAVGSQSYKLFPKTSSRALSRSRAAGAKLRGGLQQLMERYGCIGAIRERALMAGIEIVKDWETKELAFEFEKNLSARMMELGLSATISTRTSLVISG